MPIKLARATDPVTGEQFVVDLGTSNISFLQTHQELKHLGIKNNAFMLKLIDTSLAGVDPYDPCLDKNTQDRVQLECSRNFWYYAREVARVPIPSSPPVPIYLHRPSCAQYWLFTKHIDSTLDIPRRCYKTTNTIAGPYCWAYNYGIQNGNFVMFNYDNSQVWKNLDMMKGMLEALPPYMRFSMVVSDDAPTKSKKPVVKKKTDNVKSIRNPVSRNVVTTRGRAQNVESALKFGRGDAINMPYFDEAEWINYLPDILSASGSSYQEALNMALRTGAATCRLFTTTPGYLNIPSQRENYEKFIKIQPRWTEKLYDMSDEEIHEYMLNNGNGFTKILYIEYDYIQCRRDDVWLQKMLEGMNGNKLKFRTEVLLQRLSADENGPFDPYDIDYIIQNAKKPIGDMLLCNTYKFNIFEHLDVDHGMLLDPMIPYFIGVDPAEGVGGDSTAIVGINPYNLKIAFEFGSAYISEPKVIALLVSLIRMLPQSITFIETKSAGRGIIAGIRQNYPDVAARLYKSEYDPKKVYIKEAKPENITHKEYREAVESKLYGISTGVDSRKQIQDLWVEYVHSYKTVITSPGIVEELSLMKLTAANKIEASSGAHDDYAMAWGFVLWGYHHGQKLERWGFVKPEKHPLEKDPMPLREKKQINTMAIHSPSAKIMNDANHQIIQDNRRFQSMMSKDIAGHRRTVQFIQGFNGSVQQTSDDAGNWLDFIDAPDTVGSQNDDFHMFL